MLEEELKFFFSTNDTTDLFLDQIHLPTLSAESRSLLCRPITKEEVYETINLYQAGKLQVRMGSARNSIRKRPRLYSSWAPHQNVHRVSRTWHSTPTLNLANISLILKKKGKPSDCCSSYRPISLIRVDCKLLSKLLTRRLEVYLPILIKPDQTGFIRHRFSHSNAQRLLNVIQYAWSGTRQGCPLSPLLTLDVLMRYLWSC